MPKFVIRAEEVIIREATVVADTIWDATKMAQGRIDDADDDDFVEVDSVGLTVVSAYRVNDERSA